MNRVIHFEIFTANPEATIKFYNRLFDWEIKEWVTPGLEIAPESRYWLITTGSLDKPGIDGGIVFRRSLLPLNSQAINAFLCTIEVASIDQAIEKALTAGASITKPKVAIKNIGWLCHCKDPEGNIFGMLEHDKSAA